MGSPELQLQVKEGNVNYLSAKYNFHADDEAVPIWDFIEQEEQTRMVTEGLEYFRL